jgi:alginate O-acetyltransferase complex protein AlgI
VLSCFCLRYTISRMSFTSFNFVIFFPLVIVIYYVLPVKFRWIFLLLASYYFYITIEPVYAFLLIGITLTTYFFALLIDQARPSKKKKLLLVISIVVSLCPLFFFKYFNFVNDGVSHLLGYLGIKWSLPHFSVLLPIGISFYTFTALGYIIDVYNQEIEPRRNFGTVALFLAFFPLVLSGPIERATNLFHQFESKVLFNYDKIVKGLQFMLWGYFMKLVVANRIAIYEDAIFHHMDRRTGQSVFVAVLLYPIQVYADLGGYSLIAIGAARVMGIDVMQNFNRPFFATSMSEFWRRWHISLISWLTDYIYTPLAFSLRKYKIKGIVIAIMSTFIISGLWHGAALTFLIWGMLQGIFLSIEAIINKRRGFLIRKYNLHRKRWYIFIFSVFTYLLFAFSEIFGGAVDSVTKALAVIKKIFTNFSGPIYYENPSMIFFLSFGIFLVLFTEWVMEYYKGIFSFFNNRSWIIRALSYVFLIIMILLIGVFDGGQFIYFKF